MNLVASGPEGGSLAKAPPDWRFVRDLLATSLFVDIIALGYLCLHLDWQMQNETPLLTVLVTRIIFDFCLLIGWRCRNKTIFRIVNSTILFGMCALVCVFVSRLWTAADVSSPKASGHIVIDLPVQRPKWEREAASIRARLEKEVGRTPTPRTRKTPLRYHNHVALSLLIPVLISVLFAALITTQTRRSENLSSFGLWCGHCGVAGVARNLLNQSVRCPQCEADLFETGTIGPTVNRESPASSGTQSEEDLAAEPSCQSVVDPSTSPGANNKDIEPYTGDDAEFCYFCGFNVRPGSTTCPQCESDLLDGDD